MGLHVITGKRMLPSHCMYRYICEKEKGTKRDDRKGYDGSGNEKKNPICTVERVVFMKKDSPAQRSWVNSRSGKCKF